GIAWHEREGLHVAWIAHVGDDRTVERRRPVVAGEVADAAVNPADVEPRSQAVVVGERGEPWPFEIAVADDLEALAPRIKSRFLQREVEDVDADRHLRLGNRRAAAIAAERYCRLSLLACRHE